MAAVSSQQKYIIALDTAMKQRNLAGFIDVLSRLDKKNVPKDKIAQFFQANKEIFSQQFLIKRKPNPALDKLDPTIWKGAVKHICPGGKDCIIYELRRNRKKANSLLLGYLRLEKGVDEKTYVVGYIATSILGQGKGFAYLLLNAAINDVLKASPANQVILHDSSKMGTALYQSVGHLQTGDEFDVDIEVVDQGFSETWFMYKKKT